MANYSVTVDTLASAMVPALTSADVPWTSEGARIIYDVNTSVQRIYAGDNPSGNAINKTGHHEIAAGVQLSMYPAAHGGLDGKGASTLTLQPGATLRNINYATFAMDNRNFTGLKIISNGGTLYDLYRIQPGAINQLMNTNLYLQNSFLYFGTGQQNFPQPCSVNLFCGTGVSTVYFLFDQSSGGVTDWTAMLATAQIQLQAGKIWWTEHLTTKAKYILAFDQPTPFGKIFGLNSGIGCIKR